MAAKLPPLSVGSVATAADRKSSFDNILKGTPAKAPPAIPKPKSEKAYYATPAGRATTAAVKAAGGATPAIKPPTPKAPPSPVSKPTRSASPTRSAVGQKFDAAFASARKAGKGEFMFNGKSYNTKVK